MTNNNQEMLVMRVDEYKEKDGLVYGLTREGKTSFYARGIQSLASKNRRLTQPYSLVDVQIERKGSRIPMLLYGNTKQYFYKIQEDLTKQCVCMVVNDCIQKSNVNEKVYEYLLNVWSSFQKESKEVYGWACLLLKELLELNGISPYTDGCVHCGRKDTLETISMKDGGFVCHECNQNSKKSKSEMVQIFSLFHVGEQERKLLDLFEYTLDDFLYWATWFEYHNQLNLSSLQLLKQIV